MLYSIKSPSHWFWRTHWTEEQIRDEAQKGTIQEHWLVCPLGHASDAVLLHDFLDDPDILSPELAVPDTSQQSDWTCLKCGHQEFTESAIATHGSTAAKLLLGGFATRVLNTMTCTECRFTEIYAD